MIMGQHKKYTREFKLEALDLVRSSGKSIAQIERDLGLYAGQLHAWKRQFARDGAQAFPGTGHLKNGDAELRRLQREVELLRQERDILKKAIAIFSRPKP
jgi:transposase